MSTRVYSQINFEVKEEFLEVSEIVDCSEGAEVMFGEMKEVFKGTEVVWMVPRPWVMERQGWKGDYSMKYHIQDMWIAAIINWLLSLFASWKWVFIMSFTEVDDLLLALWKYSSMKGSVQYLVNLKVKNAKNTSTY